MPDSATLEVSRSVAVRGRTRRVVSRVPARPSVNTAPAISKAAREIELPEEWKGPAPAELAAGGPKMQYTSRQYALLLSSYYLQAGLPKALWSLLNCHDPWWLPEEKRPAPSRLLVPRIRLMCEEHLDALPPSFADEIEGLLEGVARAAQTFRPDWAKRLRHYQRCFRRTRQTAEAA